jgi:transcriptional regulator with GAF, ATPase, and Fis domain
MLSGELALLRGAGNTAKARLTLAKALLEKHGTEREVADAVLELTEAELASRNSAAAQALLDSVRPGIEASSADDLHTRWLLLRARAKLSHGEPAAAVSLLESAGPRATKSGEHDLLAELEAWFSRALEQQGARRAAVRHREHAIELWERCAATLPSELRDGFWQHPARLPWAPSSDSGPTPQQEPPPGAREKKLERLLSVYRRLSSSLTARDVLDFAMDAAIDLTGAERGFLIVRQRGPGAQVGAGGLRVAVARNVDRERVGRSGFKISRSIAQRVVDTGEPLLTAAAQHDERFGATESVVALGLQSVACVPIPGPAGILGALYLDNRFQHGKFGEEDLQLLLAFADQVGIALHKAQLYDELDARTRQLEKERARIGALLAEQSREVERLNEQVRLARHELDQGEGHGGILGKSSAMRAVFSIIERVAPSPVTVLIQGESGTGKELIARAIHEGGPRPKSPFVSINCAAVPEALLESELFGHVRGAFTGADRDRVGLLVHAEDGTVLLDEIGELALSLQAKLLRVLQEREVLPLGATRAQPVAARILCATNRRLRDEVAEGRFREDLFYRLAVVEITLPPLRERLEDLPLLAQHLLERRAHLEGRSPPLLTAGALHTLMRQAWPGNVRQLDNVMSQALLLCSSGRICEEDIVIPAASAAKRPRGHHAFEAVEAAEIAAALQATRYNATEVSRRLGIPRTSLYRKMKRYGLARRR